MASLGLSVIFTDRKFTDIIEPTLSSGYPSSWFIAGRLSSSTKCCMSFLTMLAGSSCKVSTISSSSSSFIRLLIFSSESDSIICIFFSLLSSANVSARWSLLKSFILRIISYSDNSLNSSAKSTGFIALIFSCRVVSSSRLYLSFTILHLHIFLFSI